MSRIAAQQLPVPLAPRASVEVPKRRGFAIGCAIAAVAGVAIFTLTRGDDPKVGAGNPTDVSSTGVGSAGNSSLSEAEIRAAYSAVFGVAASDGVVSCIAGEIGTTGGQAARLAHGEALTFDEAKEAFTPFVTCAPDADFLAPMVPAVLQVVPAADEGCVEQNLVRFDISDRALTLALAFSDLDRFATVLAEYFQGCSS